MDPVAWVLLREHDVKWYLPFRTITRLTPVPNLIELFQRKMNSSEPGGADDASMEFLPEGLNDLVNLESFLKLTEKYHLAAV